MFLFTFSVNFLVPQEVEEEIFNVVQENPEFLGGEKALLTYLSTSLKYPEEAKKKQIQSTNEFKI